MLKKVIEEYILSFRWSNIKQYKGIVYWWCFWVNMFSLGINLAENISGNTVGGIYFFLWAISFVIGMIGCSICPLKLSKIRYLCPMDKKEREDYMMMLYWVEIVIPVFLQFLIGCILVLCKKMHILMIMLNAFCTFSSMLYVTTEPKIRKNCRKQHTRKVIELVCGILSIIIMQMFIAIYIDEIMQGTNIMYEVLAVGVFIIACRDIRYVQGLPTFIQKYRFYEEEYVGKNR